MNFDHHLRDHISERTYYGVRDGMFDARDVEEKGEEPKVMMPQWYCVKAKEQSIFTQRCQDVLLLW